MKSLSIFLLLSILITGFSCTGKNTSNQSKSDARNRLEKNKPSPKTIYDIGVLAEVIEEGGSNVPPVTEINLISPQFPDHLLLTRERNYNGIAPKQWSELGIPAEAQFAFKSIYKNEQTDYYVNMKKHVVELFQRKKLDSAQKKMETFSLYRKLDLDKRKSAKGNFICLKNDKDSKQELSVFISADAKARAIKFKGEKYSHLLYHASELKGEGNSPNFVDQYFEYYQGKKRGLFNLTHSGDFDYVEYINLQTKQTLNFTIDAEASLDGENYRSSPCF